MARTVVRAMHKNAQERVYTKRTPWMFTNTPTSEYTQCRDVFTLE
jgi:hypothetical protein